MASLIAELKRRNVFKVAAVYAVTAWLITEIASVLLPPFGAPEWVFKVLVLFLVFGFPLVLIFSWAYEMTPDGLKRESDIPRDESITPRTGRKLNLVMAILVLLAAGIWYTQRDRAPIGTPSTTAGHSVAVLPFVNMSDDPANEYFSDGLSEELLNVLASVPGMHVPSRTSSFHFKGRTGDMASIGEQLNVEHVLEGSVRKSGNRIRVTAQLINVESGFHLWSDTYDRELDDVFEIQDEIAHSIIDALKVTLGAGQNEQLVEAGTTNSTAYDLYLLGRYLWHTRDVEKLRKAILLFEQAIEIDADFAPAYSGLADAWDALAWRDEIARKEVGKGIAAAKRALELNPGLVEAHASMAVLAMEFMWDWELAEYHFQKAIELNPAYPSALRWYADLVGTMGNGEKAIELCQKAIQVDPLSFLSHLSCGRHYYYARDFESAQKHYSKAFERSPDEVNIYLVFASFGMHSGTMTDAESRAALFDWAKRAGVTNPERVDIIFAAMKDANMRSQATSFIDELRADTLINDANISGLYIVIGDNESAIIALEEAYEKRDPQLSRISMEPKFDPLRDDVRFQKILTDMNLPNGPGT